MLCPDSLVCKREETPSSPSRQRIASEGEPLGESRDNLQSVLDRCQAQDSIKFQGLIHDLLVSRPMNTMTFADGSCEESSRSEKEEMQGHRRRRATQRSPATPISPKGGGGTASISLSLLLHDTHWHRVVIASRTRRRRARHKRHGFMGRDTTGIRQIKSGNIREKGG